MRYFRFISFSMFTFAMFFALSGCGSTRMGSGIGGNNSQPGTPPTVTSVAVQTDGVAPNRKQEVQFSEAMNPETINSQSFQVADSSGKSAPGTVSYDPDYNTAGFLPSPALQPGASYTATITTAAASAGGSHLAKAYSYTFTTRSDPDTSPISVASVNPAANATCVSTTSPITIDFNEAADPSTVTPGDFLVTGPSGVVSAKIGMNVSTTEVDLTPTSALPSGTITVTVSNVADLADVKMIAPYKWSFSTDCSGGEGTGSGASMQYIAPLIGSTGNSVGQVAVDTTGNVTVQLHGAAANQTFTEQFCAAVFGSQTPPSQTTLDCFPIGTVGTDGSGDAAMTAKFPRPGGWAGEFSLVSGSGNATGASDSYGTRYGPGYISTLVGVETVNTGASDSASGTITYSNSPGPNGSLTFTITGAQPNTQYGAMERDLYLDSHTYSLQNGQGQGFFTTDSAGNVTFTVLPNVPGGDIFGVLRKSPTGQIEDYTGGFLVPQ